MDRHHVLIIEDESDIVLSLEYSLQQEGFDVRSAATGAQGIALAREKVPDLIVLDLMLPDASGYDVCRTVRETPKLRAVPVIMLTARSDEADRVEGFRSGADDYVVKPFSMQELVLRVRAVLRRADADRPRAEVVTAGDLRVDRMARRVFVAGSEVALTGLEFRLLVTLMDRKDQVQSRETLLADVWDIHARIETRTVDTHIKRLREKLGAAGAYIHTVRGSGYRFDVSADQPAEP